ncbi:thiamine pyrophosphate-binding protein [Methanococcus aeolicus]|uniref:Thiamine pyrophosphate protein domain protein TPP-binding n=1 Tax=Methanococcus aeolicus (strain ATCC BAA-1280 / DSM 17508 / OCM 812 / Nankai-3) TaxID=419665 RepID=A6UX02_META3|nr:thiamine pyrophosphate-binding protein [Methanococcus aeolicus]ABR57024.1 thiamine pyrophosphate protein domain protein TPP-binding [Methanococcus aeolicus Nankai-3]UXM85021.1 thiamine pyrophosphate-binding protein [Methanococcus aeolicus]
MNFTDEILDFLIKKNIKTVFSYPGEQILPLYNGLNESPIKNIMVRSEQGASHMADGYSRITNHVGVCLATAGPGATNLMTGIATAYKDSSSVIAITGRCKKEYINKNYFQEINMDFLNLQNGYFVDAPDIKYFEKAFNESINTKKPIHLNIPYGVLLDSNDDNNRNNNENNYKDEKNNKKDNTSILNNIDYNTTGKPLLLIGQGIYGNLSYNDILKINDILKNSHIPIATTYPARGVIDENNPICLGLVGGRGTEKANQYILNCDTVYCLGASLSYNTLPPLIRDKIIPKIKDIPININNLEDIELLINTLNYKYNNVYINNIGNNINPNNKLCGDYSLKINEILNNLPDDTIITTDAGNHTVFVSLLKTCGAPKNIISSHSMGTMGFGLPASIGVKFGCLDNNIDREVVSINGDGGFQMNIQELATVSENNLKILIIIMKNNRLNIFGDIKNPDFNKIADGYNIDNIYISDIDEIENNIKYYLNNNKPYLMVVECENESLPKKSFN